MANLEPMPISSLPELDKLQDGDEAVIYRPSTGKAYQAPDLLQDLEEKIQENTDLIDSSPKISFNLVPSGETYTFTAKFAMFGWAYSMVNYALALCGGCGAENINWIKEPSSSLSTLTYTSNRTFTFSNGQNDAQYTFVIIFT